jgi:cytochrome c oxidase assembly protein subunit 15
VATKLLPPLNEQQWMAEFDKYRQTPQYQIINTHFTLSDFKFIFFWEWIHRLWGKLIGVAFLIPFAIFIYQKRISREMIPSLAILFLFGGVQAIIGWIMVLSGLSGDAIYVAPTKLAFHFVFALGLIALVFWTGLKWLMPSTGMSRPGLRSFTLIIIGILFIQLIFGALMAGHRAALAAPTWPTINGSMMPDQIFKDRPVLLNFIENTITIHFVHRGLAYLLVVLIIIWSVFAFRSSKATPIFARNSFIPLLLVCLQVVLGIFALLKSPGLVPNQWGSFEWLALLHQVVGMLLLLSMVGMLFFLTPKYRTQQL